MSIIQNILVSSSTVEYKTGKMSEIYADDPLTIKLIRILRMNGLKIPSNKEIIEAPKEEKAKIQAKKCLEVYYDAYNSCVRYRNDFLNGRESRNLNDILTKIYYFIGIYNMLSHITWVYHSFNWEKHNLLMQDTAKAIMLEQAIKFTRNILRRCDSSCKTWDFKKAVELFFMEFADNDRYIGEIYRKIDFPRVPGNLLEEFGFIKVPALDDSIKESFYLIPGYLLKALEDDDLIYGYKSKNMEDYLHYEQDVVEISEVTSGREIKTQYAPFYKNGTHIMYGFLV